MRNTIIPAQITTVEDKIAGSLSMVQILILMIPILWTTLVYVWFFPAMKLASYKLVLIILATVVCLVLVIRVKEKIVAQWLLILIKFRMRPKYYLFNKNNLTNRTVDVPEMTVEHKVSKTLTKKTINPQTTEVELSDLVKLEHLINTGKVKLHYQFENKHQ